MKRAIRSTLASSVLLVAHAHAQPVQRLTPETIDSYPAAQGLQPTDEVLGFQPQNASGKTVKVTISQILSLAGQVTLPAISSFPTAQGLVTSDLVLGYQPNAAPASRTVSIPISQLVTLALGSQFQIANYPTSSNLASTDFLLGYQPNAGLGKQTVAVPISQVMALAAYIPPVASTTVLGQIKVDGTSVYVTNGVLSAAAGAAPSGATVTTGSTAAFTGNQTFLLIDKASASATTVTLPTSPVAWTPYLVKDLGGNSTGANAITVSSSALIDGQATFTMNIAYKANAFIYNGSTWSAF